MSNFKYDVAAKVTTDILQSKTKIQELKGIPEEDSQFTYDNGIRTWVGALFVDIRESTILFKQKDVDVVSRIIRAFFNEILFILNQNTNCREIGIRGDCVYSIYSAPLRDNVLSILDDAVAINSFNKMFQTILLKNNMPTFKTGIGLGCSKDLVIKAGRKGKNHLIWVGDAVVNASKLSNQGSKDDFDVIVMDSCFYENIKEYDMNSQKKYSDVFIKKHSKILGEEVYHSSVVFSDINSWIKENYG